VFHGTVGAGPTASELHSFWAIATELDELAGQRPLGA
jgi:hypothetical protein